MCLSVFGVVVFHSTQNMADILETVEENQDKADNLVRLGINNFIAWKWTNSRKAYWRIADSYVLHRSLTKYLASVGYDDILNRYKALHSNY